MIGSPASSFYPILRIRTKCTPHSHRSWLLRDFHRVLWEKAWLRNLATCTLQEEDVFELGGMASDSRLSVLRSGHLQTHTHRNKDIRIVHQFIEPYAPSEHESEPASASVDIVFRTQPRKTKYTVTEIDAMAEVIMNIHKHLSPLIGTMKKQNTPVAFYTLTPRKRLNTSLPEPEPDWLLELERLLNSLHNGQVPCRPWSEKPKSERALTWCHRFGVRYARPCVDCGRICLIGVAFLSCFLCCCLKETVVQWVKERSRRRQVRADMSTAQRDGIDMATVGGD
jgi:hypothetical protein